MSEELSEEDTIQYEKFAEELTAFMDKYVDSWGPVKTFGTISAILSYQVFNSAPDEEAAKKVLKIGINQGLALHKKVIPLIKENNDKAN